MEQRVIQCGRLFDGVQSDFQERVDILVEGGRIVKVGKDLPEKRRAQVIDLSNATVTPGMIDAHVHLSTFQWRQRGWESIYCSEAWKGMAVLYNAERALRRGFTTLRAVGCHCQDGYASLDAKRVIAQGYFPGAELVVAPYYTGSVGGMADFTKAFSGNPRLANYLAAEYPGVGTGRDFFIASVREQAKMGADFIKLMANGGFMNPYGGPGDVQLTDEEYQAVISTAHQMRIPVTAHAYTPGMIQKLVAMGIDGIEHGSLMDEETAARMREKNVYLVPTMMQYDEIILMDEEKIQRREPKEFREKLRSYGPQLQAGREVIRGSGLRLGYGTDMCDAHPCYECGREYASWLKNGFDPFLALRAATSVNAEILRRNDIGRIQPGMRADLAAWEGDLLADPEALMDCCFVMKKDVIYETERDTLRG